jgi:hypothetical protein
VLEVGHDGGQQGTSTSFLLAPGQQDGVVVLINMDGLDAGELAKQLMAIVLSKRGSGN